MVVNSELIKDQLYEQAEQNKCGRGCLVKLNMQTYKITVIPLTCKSWTCPKCGPRLVANWRRRIQAAKPERFITLTWDPANESDPQVAIVLMKRAFANLVRIIRAQGYKFEYCAVWEFTRGGYPHIHLAQRGDYLPQKFLSKKWQYLGSGKIVDIRKVKTQHGCANELTKYLMKSTHTSKEKMPSMRLVQASKNFFDPPVIASPKEEPNDYKSFFITLSLPFIVEALEHYYRYQILAMDPNGTTHMFPSAQEQLNEIFPKGFEELDAVLRPLRRSFLTSPPEESLTFAERSEVLGL